MPRWAQYLIALAVVLIGAPAVVWLAKRSGSRLRGGVGMAMLMFGLGEALDPPSKHIIEASEGEEKQTPAPGDPPTV